MSLNWYVFRSKPNKEVNLRRELITRGFECFYPKLHVKPVNPRSRKIRPYFPGYLFLRADLDQVGSSTFEWMPFSSGFVSFGRVPATVSDSLIQVISRHIAEIHAAGGEQLVALKPGEPAIIQGGLFEGYEAIFDARETGRERARILLKLLQVGQMKVELPAIQIKRKKSALDYWQSRKLGNIHLLSDPD